MSVKLKRFAEGVSLPSGLLADRWRVYYSLAEIEDVLTPELRAGIEIETLFDEKIQRGRESDGADPLARILQADHQGVVDFYLRRNQLINRFGIETRHLLLDPRLVAFCAAIPSRFKVRGWFDSKYILRKAVERVLPHEILHRTDKLGHSIPLKNWLREDPEVRAFVLDLLSESAVRRRGLVRPDFVAHQIQEHMSRRRNNSHRLWTLAVFEMWCRRHLDGTGIAS